MAFILSSSGGNVVEPALVNMYASGVVRPNNAVDLVRGSFALVSPTTSSSTTTMVFGMAMDYAQGASDTLIRVTPFDVDQLWTVDCANAAVTGQIGVTHALSASDRSVIHNTNTNATSTGIFLAVAMTGASTGSGKLIGRFISNLTPQTQNSTTFI